MVSSAPPDLTSRALRHERAIVGASVTLLAALAWWYIAAGSSLRGSPAMSEMGTPSPGALVLMWSLMMVGMMLPSAAPAILLYARVRAARGDDPAIAGTWVFLVGYLTVWLLFSIVAAILQHMLADSRMTFGNPLAQSAVLVAAGAYQLSRVKSACLRECRSPGQFISRHWRPGWQGAVMLGLRHGAYCVGCCWMLMMLLFVFGVMNLLWVVGLTVIVAIEKLVPRGDFVGRAAGVALILWVVLRMAARINAF